jgi:hypothetical protein
LPLPAIAERHPRVEEVLDAFASELGRDRAAYRGHVYRVFNLCRALAPVVGGWALTHPWRPLPMVGW